VSYAIVDELVASGRLLDFVSEAAVESIAPLCGIDVTVLGEGPLPWSAPPAGIALISLADTAGSGFQGVAWVGGSFEALASLAETLMGERPSEEDEMLQDSVRELANIVAGRMQERLHRAGMVLSLGLPVYVGGARSLNLGASLVNGVSARVQLELPSTPVLAVGFAVKEG
jgi:CheY-specific phosphatase CheX